MINNNIFDDLLTEEEKTFLLKIDKKIAAKLEEIKEHKFDHLDNQDLDLSEKHPEIISKTHITDCPHEIKISVVAEVSSIDDRGFLKDLKDIIKKYYHIPVMTDQNYMDYVDKFFQNFEDKLTATCKESINNQNNAS